MKASDNSNLFHFTFQKHHTVIVQAAKKKATELLLKIEERKARVIKLREEYGIDDAALIQLLTQARSQQQAHSYTYMSNAPVRESNKIEEKTIGAGVVNNLLTENDFIEAERSSVDRLNTIVRNLGPVVLTDNGALVTKENFELSYQELKYLGF